MSRRTIKCLFRRAYCVAVWSDGLSAPKSKRARVPQGNVYGRTDGDDVAIYAIRRPVHIYIARMRPAVFFRERTPSRNDNEPAVCTTAGPPSRDDVRHLLAPNLWTVTVYTTKSPFYIPSPLPSSRHHRSNGDCLEGKRENYQVCSEQYCVQQLCTVQCTHISADLTVLWIGFCLAGPISLCLGSFVHCVSLYIVCMRRFVTW